MNYLSTEERERSKVVLSEVFVESDLVVESPAVPKSRFGETLLIFGEQNFVSSFLENVSALLGKGDSRYFWNSVRHLSTTQIVLSMIERDPNLRVPRLELLQRLFLQDLLRHSTVQVRQFYRLTVLTPSGSVIHSSKVEVPSV